MRQPRKSGHASFAVRSITNPYEVSIATAWANSSNVSIMSPSGSGSAFQPSESATRFKGVKPILRHSLACEGAVLGESARCMAPASSTANRPINHESQGSGERKSNRIGYVV